MVVFRKFLMGILTPSQEIIDLGSIYLIITACTLIPQNLHGVITGALKGAGLTKPPMYISVICLWGIRLLTTTEALQVQKTAVVLKRKYS